MQPFSYSGDQLQALERSLSSERLNPYRVLAKGDLAAAVKLHELNTSLAEALYGTLQGLEVSLRNAIHDALTDGLGTSNWYEEKLLQKAQQIQLERAKEALTREDKPLDPGRIVAELSFGFWTGLMGPGYTDLWRAHLVKAFPRRTLQRIDAHGRLNTIRKLRNRVAHHEPILNRPLNKDFNWIVDTIAWICPVTANWVKRNSSFPQRWSDSRKSPAITA